MIKNSPAPMQGPRTVASNAANIALSTMTNSHHSRDRLRNATPVQGKLHYMNAVYTKLVAEDIELATSTRFEAHPQAMLQHWIFKSAPLRRVLELNQ